MTRPILPQDYATPARSVSIPGSLVCKPSYSDFPEPGRSVISTNGQKTGHLTLRLGGSFAALDTAGQPIHLSQKKGRMMLAMLACAPGMKRSRDWLRRHLWHRSFTAHGFSSLRQCLHNLRHALGEQGLCLCADRDFIWLESTTVDWAGSYMQPELFLEDMPSIDGPSTDWLEAQRVRLGSERRGSAA